MFSTASATWFATSWSNSASLSEYRFLGQAPHVECANALSPEHQGHHAIGSDALFQEALLDGELPLLHWRSASTKVTSAMGVPQIRAANEVRSSKSRSGSVSRML